MLSRSWPADLVSTSHALSPEFRAKTGSSAPCLGRDPVHQGPVQAPTQLAFSASLWGELLALEVPVTVR